MRPLLVMAALGAALSVSALVIGVRYEDLLTIIISVVDAVIAVVAALGAGYIRWSER